MVAPTSFIPISVDDAYGWLNQFEESHLRPASKQLLELIKCNISISDFRKGWATLKELKTLSEQDFAEHESAEILIHCGWAAFKMSNEAEAIRLLKDAFNRALLRHQRAVAGSMWGCILWLQPDLKMCDAIHACEASMENFDHLARQRTLSLETAKWYKDHSLLMENYLRQMIDPNRNRPATSPGASHRPSPPPPPPPTPPSSHYPSTSPAAQKQKRHRIRSFPVLGTIPAGIPASVAEPAGTMIFEELILDEDRYRIISLKRGESIINLPDSSEYYVLQVSGNSMNKAEPEPIENGDYVILRAQNIAENNDIVAVEIVGLDDRATLKRYSIESGKIVLKPESNDPAFQLPITIRREFTKLDDNFHIRGIALAVLKRIED